jgi:carboxyl-terminal processing protease
MKPWTVWLAAILVCVVTGTAHAEGDYASPYARLEVFSKVLALIEQNHVGNARKKDLVTGAIEGMLRVLDAHSSYLTPEEFKILQEDTSGQFCGVGMEVGIRDGALTVIAPIPNSPAAAAGILTGDVVVQIEGVPFEEMDLEEAVQRMRGTEGTDVTITIVRKGKDEPFDVTLTRAHVKIQAVEVVPLEGAYLQIKVKAFSEGVSKTVKKALRQNAHVKGVVLDLRGNPGGLLREAVFLSELFLREGKIVSTRGRDKQLLESYEARRHKQVYAGRMVVLVDGGSASASEIVAGALKDNRRALVVGTRTFGKGSVQTIIPMNDGSGLKLTTALYYTPSGTSIQATGIVPDVEVAAAPLNEEKNVEETKMLSERDLQRHIENGDTASIPPAEKIADRPLRLAFEILQGVERVMPQEEK